MSDQKIDLTKLNRVHFIGIGGIGISAIARMFQLEGKTVSGSDRGESKVTEELRTDGITVFLEQKAENIPAGVELVIYTIAIPADNPEFVRAKELGVTMLTYPQALGLVSAEKYTIAVSGTHGKTTTTAMLVKIFRDAGLDPTAVVGSLIPELQSNLVIGRSKYFITEACEYKRSFLNLNPQAVVITNIDNDHLDYYKDLADIQSAFMSLVEKIPGDGFLVCDTADELLKPVMEKARCRIIDYPTILGGSTSKLELKLSGEHNQKDAKAALAVALELGVDKQQALAALANFTGTWRRFEFKGIMPNGAVVYDDYAHHPTEIKATLRGAREWIGGKKIIVAFQPHLYSRTKLLLDDFAASFDDADTVIVTDIYAAREVDDGTINSKDLVEKINVSSPKAEYVSNFSETARIISERAQMGDLVITMGAGDIFKVGESLVAPMIKTTVLLTDNEVRG